MIHIDIIVVPADIINMTNRQLKKPMKDISHGVLNFGLHEGDAIKPSNAEDRLIIAYEIKKNIDNIGAIPLISLSIKAAAAIAILTKRDFLEKSELLEATKYLGIILSFAIALHILGALSIPPIALDRQGERERGPPAVWHRQRGGGDNAEGAGGGA